MLLSTSVVSNALTRSWWLLAVLLLLVLLARSTLASETVEFEKRCHEEVVALHVVIEDWLAGKVVADDDVYASFSDAMASDFEIISPSGVRSERGSIVAALRKAHGVQGADFSISIKNLRTRMLAPPLALLSYEEWQSQGNETTARLSTVLLREDPGAPRGVAWVHLQETWLPAMAPKGPQDL